MTVNQNLHNFWAHFLQAKTAINHSFTQNMLPIYKKKEKNLFSYGKNGTNQMFNHF